MRTRSACIAILLALSASAALSVVACSPDATAPARSPHLASVATERKVQALRDQYDWAGKYHTDGLHFVYARLKENSGKAKQKNHMCKVAAKAVKEFHRNARKGDVPLAFLDPSLSSETCGTEVDVGRIGKNVIAGNPRVRTDVLSPLAVAYMDQIAHAINSATSRAALLNALLSIEYAAVVNLTSAQAGAIIATVSVAISSMDYWEQNLDAWTSLPGAAMRYNRLASAVGIAPPSSPRMVGSPKWWNHPAIRGYLKIVAADAAGAARVLYTSWAVGPIGWDAAAAMALWSSTTMCLSLLF